MTVLLSIKPEFAEKIFSGVKRYEFRRVMFKSEVSRVVVYASAPVSMVIGEFDIKNVFHDDLEALWILTSVAAGITRQLFDAYFSGRSKGYAIEVSMARRYESPRCLRENYRVSPPQSFVYLESSGLRKETVG